MKRKNALFLIGVVIVMAAAVGFLPGLFSGSNQKNPGAGQTGETGVVTRQEISPSVLATGIIKPCVGAEVRVGSRVSGIVKKLHVKIGDRVKKGQLLGELDPTEFKARFNQAQATMENANARLIYAELTLKRLQGLKKKDAVAQDKVDEAEKTRNVTIADLKQSRADLDYAGIQLGYSYIRAPIEGVVAAVSTQEGETVAASFSAPTFVIIIDLSRLEVWAYVDETDIGRIEEGQKAFFTVDTYPGVDFEGKVTAVYPKAEMKDNVVDYITIIDITDRKGFTLRPEMTTTVKIFQQTMSKL